MTTRRVQQSTGRLRAAGRLHQIHVCPALGGQGVGGQLPAVFVRFLRDASLTTGVPQAWERDSRALACYARHLGKPDYVRMRLDLAEQGLN